MRTVMNHRIELKTQQIQQAQLRQCMGAFRFAHHRALAASFKKRGVHHSARLNKGPVTFQCQGAALTAKPVGESQATIGIALP